MQHLTKHILKLMTTLSKYISEKEFALLLASKNKSCTGNDPTMIPYLMTCFMYNQLQNRILTGAQFNKLFPPDILQIHKTLPTDMISNGVQLTEGLNIDPNEFNTDNPCTPGGFYSSPNLQFFAWLIYKKHLTLVANITYPPDALIFVEINSDMLLIKLKSSQIIISNITSWFSSPHISGMWLKCTLIEWIFVNCCDKAIKEEQDAKHRKKAVTFSDKECTCGYCEQMCSIMTKHQNAE